MRMQNYVIAIGIKKRVYNLYTLFVYQRLAH